MTRAICPTLAIMTAALAGCSTSTGILPMGPDTYTVSVSSPGTSGGIAAQQKATKEAIDYCGGLGVNFWK